jgi:hypothetical protein
MTEAIFETWFQEVFLPHTVGRRSAERPAVLFLDNFGAHCSIDVVKVAREHYVEMLAFCPHGTHILQPLDLAIIGPLKHHYDTARQLWRIERPEHQAFRQEHVRNAFATAGIHPFDPSKGLSRVKEASATPAGAAAAMELSPLQRVVADVLRPPPVRRAVHQGREEAPARLLTASQHLDRLEAAAAEREAAAEAAAAKREEREKKKLVRQAEKEEAEAEKRAKAFYASECFDMSWVEVIDRRLAGRPRDAIDEVVRQLAVERFLVNKRARLGK